jgi:CBS-domain-containing membrane protein
VLLKDAALSAVGCFTAIGALATVHYEIMDGSPLTLVLGSMGATAVLVFGAPASPFSQPRNVIGGHVVSATCGILANTHVLPVGGIPLALAVAVGSSVLATKLGKCVHPPAGGTALLAVLGSAQLHAMGCVWGMSGCDVGLLLCCLRLQHVANGTACLGLFVRFANTKLACSSQCVCCLLAGAK